MSDLTLSQDEIDALLTGSSAPAAKKTLSPSLDAAFKALLADAAPGQSNAIAGMMDGKSVTLGTPTLELVERDSLLDNLPQEVVELRSTFSGDANAEHIYFLSPQDAITLISPIMGQTGVELNGGTLNALEEVASMMTGSLSTTLGNKSKKNVTPGPFQGEKTVKAMVQTPLEEMILVRYPLTLDGNTMTLFEVFPQAFAMALTGAAGAPESKGPKTEPVNFGDFGASAGGPPPQQNFGNPYGMPGGQAMGYPPQGAPGGMPGGMPGYGQPMGYQMPQMGGYPGGPPPGGWPNVQGVQFPSLVPSGAGNEAGNIGLLLDVSMEVSVELGRAKRQIKDILGMGEGTIIQLDKLAGESVDILVNHKLIAKGEVVVIEENFGVRVTEIVTQPEKFNEN